MMKKFTLFLVFIIISINITSCLQDENSQIEVIELENEQDINKIIESGEIGIPFPEGSQVFKYDDKYLFKLPQDHYYLVKDKNSGEIFDVDMLGVTCSCTSGSGCSPVSYKGSSYCVMASGCHVCSKTTTASKNGFEYDVEFIGLINEIVGVNFLGKEDLFLVKSNNNKFNYSLTKEFFESEFVKNELHTLNKLIYNGNIPEFILNNDIQIPNNYEYVNIDFYGNNFLFILPIEIIKDLNLDIIEKSAASCSCSQGTGCKMRKLLGAVYCDAGNCTICSLSTNPK